MGTLFGGKGKQEGNPFPHFGGPLQTDTMTYRIGVSYNILNPLWDGENLQPGTNQFCWVDFGAAAPE